MSRRRLRHAELTPAERAIFELMERGLKPRDIVAETGLTLTTVKTRLAVIRAKLRAQQEGTAA